ncbi:winged helix-turn-helix domain-containing protein [Jatrophihabitans sp.]|uniref:winged helix-turn-helix domain-containing protein n=1 Tax=Jatrophihabitans sp. TaxID=1932789 RepID=UPI0030C6BBCD|nr:Helix-turn-helix domain protein [Jatrophihabitans sp.]
MRRLEVGPESLKAMAHPLRVEMLRLLQLRQRASVTSLAAELGETTGAISYHLRQLARHGFVEEFTPEADAALPRSPGRQQRWWRMAVDEIHTTGFGMLGDDSTRAAADFVLRDSAEARSRALTRWYETAVEWPAEWQRASSDADDVLDLDPTQTRALADELAALLNKYRAAPKGEGTRRVHLQYATFPADVR